MWGVACTDLLAAAELVDGPDGKPFLANRMLVRHDYFLALPNVAPTAEEFKASEEEDSSFTVTAGVEGIVKGHIVRFDGFYDRYEIRYTDSTGVEGSIWRKHDVISLPDKSGLAVEWMNDA